MKMSRRERKILNEGKKIGYAVGYAEGLHDGNPFIAIGEAIADCVNYLGDFITKPEMIEYLKEEKEKRDALESTFYMQRFLKAD